MISYPKLLWLIHVSGSRPFLSENGPLQIISLIFPIYTKMIFVMTVSLIKFITIKYYKLYTKYTRLKAITFIEAKKKNTITAISMDTEREFQTLNWLRVSEMARDREKQREGSERISTDMTPHAFQLEAYFLSNGMKCVENIRVK